MNLDSIRPRASWKTGITTCARIVALAAAISAAASAEPARRYRLVNLDAAVGEQVTPVAINDAGIVALGGRSGLFLYDSNSGEITRPPQPGFSSINGLSNNGNIAGVSFASGALGWFVIDGVFGTVPFPGGTGSEALAVNDRGQVAGFISVPGGLFGTTHAVIYSARAQDLTDLGTFGGTGSAARAINDRGQVAGSINLPGPLFSPPQHAFLFTDGAVQDLGTFGGRSSSAAAIDAHGRVAGFAEFPGPLFDAPRHAFLFDQGGMHDLGTLPGRTSSEATAMNDHGDAVGQSSQGALNTAHAVLFTDGQVIDLNDVAPDPDGFVHQIAVGINNRGEIIGTSTANFTFRSFLLVPVDD